MMKFLMWYESHLVERLIRTAMMIERVRGLLRAYDKHISKGPIGEHTRMRHEEWKEEFEQLQRYHAKTRKRIHTVNRWMEFWE